MTSTTTTIMKNHAQKPKAAKENDTRQHDHSRTLWLIRILQLTFYASRGSIQPFLSVYFHSLGHSGLVIGVLGAIQPLVSFVVSPFWGLLADSYNEKHQKNRHFVLQICLVGWVIATILLPWRDHDVFYLIRVVLLRSIFQAPLPSFIDAVAMEHLSRKDQYGRLRLFGTIGFGLGTSVVGYLVNRANVRQAPPSAFPEEEGSTWFHKLSPNVHFGGYRIAFIAFAMLSILCWLCIQTLARTSSNTTKVVSSHSSRNKSTAKEETKVKEGLRMLLRNRDALLFLFLVFVSGLNMGCSENFTYVRMQEVGATSTYIGNTRLVASTSGAIMFWFADALKARLGGPLQVLLLSPLLYATRFLIYGTMTGPYHAIPAEILRGINFGAFCSTATVYAHKISPPGATTTMLMFQNAIASGLGPSLGAIVCGRMQSMLGTATTFVNVGVFNLCVVSLIVTYLGVRDSQFRARFFVSKTLNTDPSVKEKSQ